MARAAVVSEPALRAGRSVHHNADGATPARVRLPFPLVMSTVTRAPADCSVKKRAAPVPGCVTDGVLGAPPAPSVAAVVVGIGAVRAPAAQDASAARARAQAMVLRVMARAFSSKCRRVSGGGKVLSFCS